MIKVHVDPTDGEREAGGPRLGDRGHRLGIPGTLLFRILKSRKGLENQIGGLKFERAKTKVMQEHYIYLQ